MATTAAAVVAKARRDVMSHFLSRDAVSPERAVPYQPDRRIRRRMFEQFQRAGVLKAGKTGWYSMCRSGMIIRAVAAGGRAR